MLEKKTFYLTEERLENLKKEQERLKKIRIVKLRGEFPNVFNSEDVNPEYLYFYEDLDFIETRLAHVNNILKNAELIKPPPPEKRNIINLGATVIVEVAGQTDEFEIVGPLESNPSLGKISNESPVGSTILGHKVGDKVLVSSPIRVIYKIKKVIYPLLKGTSHGKLKVQVSPGFKV